MKKSYFKISIIAYANIVIIFLLELMHNQLMNISESLLFGILLIYALINGWYIQRIIIKQRKFEEKLSEEKIFSNHILESISSGIMILDNVRDIKYVNKSAEKTLNVSGNSHNDIDKFFKGDTKKIEKLIQKALFSNNSNRLNMHHIVNDRESKHLLVEALPFKLGLDDNQIMLYIEDLTENVELSNKLEKQYLNMFKSFVKFIDAKDTYTGLHSSNVSEYVQLIVEQLDISEDEKKDIVIAANLHDIGKIGVPEMILNKAGRLTEEEFTKMREHPVIGETLIGEIEGYERISEIIRHHHERVDGNGYPDKLKSSQIPLGSKIVAVADAFDAITTDRIYQKCRSVEEGLTILIEEKGRQFDEVIVDIFINEYAKRNKIVS